MEMGTIGSVDGFLLSRSWGGGHSGCGSDGLLVSVLEGE